MKNTLDLNGQPSIVVLVLFGLAPLVAGCGGSKGPDRLPIHGTVTLLNGEKFNGTITFKPAGRGSGVAANAKVQEGSYQFDRSNGPTAGPKTVIVKRLVARDLHALSKKAVSNEKLEWTRSAEVSDAGDYLYNFELD